MPNKSDFTTASARKLSVLHVVLIIGFIGMVPANMFLVNLKDAQHEDGGAEVGSGGHMMVDVFLTFFFKR